MKKAVIILIGIALLTGVIATGTYGLSQENIDIYTQAVALQKDNGNIGFEDFFLTDYNVAFYDGENDYVLTTQHGNCVIEKRSAVYDAIVATAYPVDDHFEVLAPTIEKMSSTVELFGVGEFEYGTEEQISTIWHEAFHCYQLTSFEKNIEEIISGKTDEVSESIITEKADANSEAVVLFEKQAMLLKSAVKSDDIDEIREYIVEYKKLETKRKAMLSEDVIATEEYYKRVEGTACYIEACIYRMLKPNEFEVDYIDSISNYSNGSGKYYYTGMAQCMILDKLNAEWKSGYNFSESVIELIYEELEI